MLGLGTQTTKSKKAMKLLGIKTNDEPASTSKAGSKWKLLTSDRLTELRVEMDSLDEKLDEMEQDHLIERFHMRKFAANILDCQVQGFVIDEIDHINNHMIIMTKNLSGLYDLILPLRSKAEGPLKYIVILYPHEIPPDVWRRIGTFEAVLLVRGSPTEETDIRRAGIFRARRVVMVAEVPEHQHTSRDDRIGKTRAILEEDESLNDADAVFTYKCIKRLNPSAHIVVEMIHHGNVTFLDPLESAAITKSEYKLNPYFASGSIFTASLIDSLVVMVSLHAITCYSQHCY